MIHIFQILRVIGILLLIVAFFMIFPIAFALYYRELDMVRSFVLPMILMGALGSLVMLATRQRRIDLSPKDGFLLVSLSWIAAALFSCLPFCLSGAIPSFTDAFFETMSGFTTTGASILEEIESLPKSILFWRSMTHWLGGMGIVVLTCAILPILGIGAYQLIKAEAPGPTLDRITPKITSTAKILWYIYLFLTVAETSLLMAGGMNLFDALTHTFGTLATGGFSPKNRSVGHYNSGYIDGIITLFMLLAGMNFILFYRVISGNIRRFFTNVEMRVYLAVFAIATVIMTFVLLERQYESFGTSLRYAAFQAATVLTTTGYVTADYAAWPFLAQTVLFLLMFVGGCSGSTGGGIKVIRIITMAKLAFNEMKYLAHPRGIFAIRLEGRTLKKDVVYTIGGFFFLYILMLLITAVVVASGGNDILTSVTSALVTLGNIGPGFGKIGPTGNYAFFPAYVKWFLSFAMLIGRLELYTVLVLLTPKFWHR
jgi:trk system potassium uptake protein TrkH